MKKYCVLGTDNRSLKLRQLYIDEGKILVSYDMANIVIAPMPFSRDNIKINGEIIQCIDVINAIQKNSSILYTGAISEKLKSIMDNKKIKYYDLLKYDELAILNAIPTAEGAINTAIGMTDFTLNGSNILVMGYGRIGKVLSKMLTGFGANIYCEARKEKDISMIKAMGYNYVILGRIDEYLPNMNLIFNTIPHLILDEKRLKLLNPNCAIVDIASNPGGVDFLTAKNLNLNVAWTLSMPAKVAPYTSAKYIKNIVESIEKEYMEL